MLALDVYRMPNTASLGIDAGILSASIAASLLGSSLWRTERGAGAEAVLPRARGAAVESVGPR